MTNKEAIINLNRIYGFVSPDIQRSLDLAIKALEEYPTDKEIQDDMRKTYLGGKEESSTKSALMNSINYGFAEEDD